MRRQMLPDAPKGSGTQYRLQEKSWLVISKGPVKHPRLLRESGLSNTEDTAAACETENKQKGAVCRA